MKAILRIVLFSLLALASLGGVKGQNVPPQIPVGIYGNESKVDRELHLTLMKPDSLLVDCVILSSGKDNFIIPAKKWIDPTDGSPSEEMVINLPLDDIDFSNQVVIKLLHQKKVVGTQVLIARKPYGEDFLDFFEKE